MRTMAFAALSAALLMACGDDSGKDGDDQGVDASARDASAPHDATLGGGGDASSTGRALASLVAKNNSGVAGMAIFEVRNGVVTLAVAINGATPGQHGIHIHEKGDCSAADASSAGGHWNPDMHTHGSGSLDASASSHLGDLGNITVGADGKGVLSVSKTEWTLGTGSTTDVVGHAVVVHANEDDLTTQAGDAGPGNSGGRQACGVISAL